MSRKRLSIGAACFVLAACAALACFAVPREVDVEGVVDGSAALRGEADVERVPPGS